jgi:hypothetical protein
LVILNPNSRIVVNNNYDIATVNIQHQEPSLLLLAETSNINSIYPNTTTTTITTTTNNNYLSNVLNLKRAINKDLINTNHYYLNLLLNNNIETKTYFKYNINGKPRTVLELNKNI